MCGESHIDGHQLASRRRARQYLVHVVVGMDARR